MTFEKMEGEDIITIEWLSKQERKEMDSLLQQKTSSLGGMKQNVSEGTESLNSKMIDSADFDSLKFQGNSRESSNQLHRPYYGLSSEGCYIEFRSLFQDKQKESEKDLSTNQTNIVGSEGNIIANLIKEPNDAPKQSSAKKNETNNNKKR